MIKYVFSLCVFTSLFASNESFDATIPVLDMNDYYDIDKKESFLQTMKEALSDVGFFAITNTGVDTEIMNKAYEACYGYFALSYEEKMETFDISLNGQRGYVPSESAKGASYKDCKEFYHVGREIEDPFRIGIYPNVWPKNYDLKTPLVEFYNALEKYTVLLQEAVATILGEPTHLFTNMTKEGDSLLRAIHYPANPPTNALWAAPHTDIDLFTILPRATGDGLEVLNKEGEWILVKVPENAFIVNAGDMLENISNGEFRSSRHRVRAQKDGYERFSIVFFIHPKSSDRLDPLPSAIARAGGVQKYANATRLELLEERLVDLGIASPEMMRHLAASGLMERLIAVNRASPKAMKALKDAGLASQTVLDALNQNSPK